MAAGGVVMVRDEAVAVVTSGAMSVKDATLPDSLFVRWK